MVRKQQQVVNSSALGNMCHRNPFFPHFLQASFLSSGFSILFFFIFGEREREETLSVI